MNKISEEIKGLHPLFVTGHKNIINLKNQIARQEEAIKEYDPSAYIIMACRAFMKAETDLYNKYNLHLNFYQREIKVVDFKACCWSWQILEINDIEAKIFLQESDTSGEEFDTIIIVPVNGDDLEEYVHRWSLSVEKKCKKLIEEEKAKRKKELQSSIARMEKELKSLEGGMR